MWQTQSQLTTHQDEEKKLLAAIEDAQKNAGETEVRDAWRELSNFYGRIGDEPKYLESFRKVYELTAGSLLKCDLLFGQILFALQYNDFEMARSAVQRAYFFEEQGSLDYEHKNRLTVFRAALDLRYRKVSEAATLLLSSMSSFMSTEVFSFEEFIRYIIITSPLTLTRPQLKEKVIDAPEVLSVVNSPVVADSFDFLTHFYHTRYAEALTSLLKVFDTLSTDKLLSLHLKWLFRELRLRCYRQHLSAYVSVNLESMSRLFGVPVDVLLADVRDFIVAGRLSCSIDGEAGVLFKHVREGGEEQGNVLKQTDVLLSKIQTLARQLAIA
ncbi:hypothetical protein RCL1_007156 [Eukaryota sp. TZLM3-RCL]